MKASADPALHGGQMDPPLPAGLNDHYDDPMVREVTATEAKAKLLALLDEVENGEPVDITRHGRRVARIVPAMGGVALWGQGAGLVEILVSDEELVRSPLEWDEGEWLKKFDDL